MSVHKPKFKNIDKDTIDAIVKHHISYELWMMNSAYAAGIRGSSSQFEHNKNVEVFALHVHRAN